MSSTNINLNMFSVVALFITNEELFDISLFNELVNTMLDDIEQKKLKILLNILSSDKINVNPISFSKSFGTILNLFIGILQVFFSKINLDNFNNELVDWLETDNENEQEYLYSAEVAKKIHELIRIFQNKSKNSLVVNSTTIFLKNINNKEMIMIKCCFANEYISN
jgi:hypothetical protein